MTDDLLMTAVSAIYPTNGLCFYLLFLLCSRCSRVSFCLRQVRSQALSLVQDWGIAFQTDRSLAYAETYGR